LELGTAQSTPPLQKLFKTVYYNKNKGLGNLNTLVANHYSYKLHFMVTALKCNLSKNYYIQ